MQLESEKLALRLRKQVLSMVFKAKASHIGSCYSIIDILAILYEEIMNYSSDNPTLPNRDRFILSKGHAAAAVYAVLAEKGFISHSLLDEYGMNGSLLMTHVNHKIPGVEFSTGSLGHGMGFGVGKAMTAKMQGQDWRTFVVMSDGELDEGSNWEAFMFAAHHKLDNLVAIVDYNKLQSLTTTQKTLGLEPLIDKFLAFGWCVKEVNGHSHIALKDALSDIPPKTESPTLILAHTIKGKGVSFMENKVEWHYKSPDVNFYEKALQELEALDA